jgi:hypothetical protein|tara:strand:+ start:75 stop:398 length:324 start_codon:yes stop_codon:yes gene_type:complete
MAITKTFNTAVPYISAGKVVEWVLGSSYVNGVSGTSQYYVTEFSTTLNADNGDFTPKAEASWTRAQLEALLPTSQWDQVFASQIDSVITNPPVRPVPDNNYVIPDES